MVNVNVEAVCLAWVNVVPKSELLGEVAALALGAVADVGHVLTFLIRRKKVFHCHAGSCNPYIGRRGTCSILSFRETS